MLHGSVMVFLGLALLYVRGSMTNLFFDFIGGVFALLLVVASLLFIALADWMSVIGFGAKQVSRLRRLLFLSTATGVGGLLLILSPAPTTPMLCYFVAAYALLLGVGKIQIAMRWRGDRGGKALMWVLALFALLFSGVLVGVAGKGDWAAVTALAIYSLFMGIQMFLCLLLLQRSSQREEPSPENAVPGPRSA